MRDGRHKPPRHHRRGAAHRFRRAVFAVFGSLAILIGGGILLALAFAPEQAEYAYGTTKTALTRTLNEARAEVFGEIPEITLGRTGDLAELDSCDGTFTEMTSYEGSGAPPVWAAHNSCSGDVLLPWEIGQHVKVKGSTQVYEVIDIRHTPQVWATFDDIEGLEGDLALQTCFYGEDKMKFVGLRPVIH